MLKEIFHQKINCFIYNLLQHINLIKIRFFLRDFLLREYINTFIGDILYNLTSKKMSNFYNKNFSNFIIYLYNFIINMYYFSQNVK